MDQQDWVFPVFGMVHGRELERQLGHFGKFLLSGDKILTGWKVTSLVKLTILLQRLPAV